MKNKYYVTLFIVIAIMCMTTVICTAKTVDDKGMGLSYDISDNWIDVQMENGYSYRHKDSAEERLTIFNVKSEGDYFIEFSDEETLKNLCDEFFSDAKLASSLTQENGVFVSVKTDSVISNFEYYNGRKFYRYEKAYTASAISRKDTPFYATIFLTIQNGDAYFFVYERNYSDAQHFNDVARLLDSLSFKNGEIKIVINGEQIFPDTAPILYNDRTLVPIRAIAEKMNYSVAWDAENQLVILTSKNGKNILHFEIDSDIALKNLSKEIKLDVPATVIGDRTYLPLRAVAEAMDANVSWNEESKAVIITY